MISGQMYSVWAADGKTVVQRPFPLKPQMLNFDGDRRTYVRPDDEITKALQPFIQAARLIT